jgi:hypothetical protein
LELIRCRQELESVGHKCTSRWLDGSSAENAATAKRDIEDIERATGLILFCEKSRCPTRNGRLVELGVALGLGGKVVMAIGGIENIFLRLPQITRFNTWKECLAHLGKKRDRATIARRAA